MSIPYVHHYWGQKVLKKILWFILKCSDSGVLCKRAQHGYEDSLSESSFRIQVDGQNPETW